MIPTTDNYNPYVPTYLLCSFSFLLLLLVTTISVHLQIRSLQPRLQVLSRRQHLALLRRCTPIIAITSDSISVGFAVVGGHPRARHGRKRSLISRMAEVHDGVPWVGGGFPVFCCPRCGRGGDAVHGAAQQAVGPVGE